MRKLFYYAGLLMFAAGTQMMTACGSDDDNKGNNATEEFAEQYFSVENGTFHSGAMPESTTSEALTGVQMNDNALAGGSNFITITTEQEYERFYVAIEGQSGYVDIVPSNEVTRAAGPYTYVLPLTYGVNLSNTVTMNIKGRTPDGKVTQAFRKTITFVDSMEGELTINLTFDKEKDLDLHLLTPSGKHIYYGNRTWSVEVGNGEIKYGLDHDSNAGCDIDGLNNENIVIPEEAIEAGEYQAYIELYANCDNSLGTNMNWQLAVRYKGQLVTNTSPTANRNAGDNSIAWSNGATTVQSYSPTLHNPVYGRYPHDAYSGTQVYVMNFTITNSTRGNAQPVIKSTYVPTLRDQVKMLDRQEQLN